MPVNAPRMVTITGIDVHTDLTRAKALCVRYPLEFAMMCDPDREGRNTRVPDPGFAAELARHFAPNELAFHLCGEYAGAALRLDLTQLDDRFGLSRVRRLQVNTSHHSAQDITSLQRLARLTGCIVIAQSAKDVIPFVDGVQFLDDQSAGRGVIPEHRAPPDPAYIAAGSGVPVGYAGGLSPSNIAMQLASLQQVNPSHPYWIDAASGVRNEENHLDLDLVETFLDVALTTA